MKLARIHHHTEPIWHVQIAILVAIVSQVLLHTSFVLGPHYALAMLEGAMLLAVTLPGGNWVVFRRLLAIGLLLLITVTNIGSLVLVSNALLNGGVTDGHVLIYSALLIYATNIIIFGLLYWELDNRNNDEGSRAGENDFLFPQMTTSSHITKQENWQPTFFDYLYVSITNAAAFSPTDALPLTYRAKALMSVQAFTSLATIALVAARAVNILK